MVVTGLMWGAAMVASNVLLMPLDRIIYGTKIARVDDRETDHFQRPFFLEFVMFLAMAGCLLLEVPAWRRRDSPRRFWPPLHVCLRLFVPAFCDLVGSWCIFTGALWVPASVVEMLACTNTIFTLLLSMRFLGKRPERHEWVGIWLSVVGLLAVGASRLASVQSGARDDGTDSSSMGWLTPLGLMLVVIAHFWYATEFVVTEHLLGQYEVSAFLSVGVMGVWGIAMFAVIFPLLSLTPSEPPEYAVAWHEQFGSSVIEIARTPALLVAVIAILILLLLFNAAAFKTTELLSAMTRVVIGSLTSPLVWVFDLCLTLFGLRVGASETLSRWSILQVLGFSVILCGTLVYNALLPWGRREGTEARDLTNVSLVDVRGGAA